MRYDPSTLRKVPLPAGGTDGLGEMLALPELPKGKTYVIWADGDFHMDTGRRVDEDSPLVPGGEQRELISTGAAFRARAAGSQRVSLWLAEGR